jgi:hypothetical protein
MFYLSELQEGQHGSCNFTHISMPIFKNSLQVSYLFLFCLVYKRRYEVYFTKDVLDLHALEQIEELVTSH